MGLTRLNTNAIETSGFSDLKSGRKNLIINGGFDVWQRGTSFSGHNFYTADRWKTNVSVAPTSQTFDKIQELNKNLLRWQCTTTGVAVLQQRIEGNRLADKTVTLSFWAKGSGSGLSLKFRTYHNGSWIDTTLESNIVLTGTLTKYTYTTTAHSISTVPTSSDFNSIQFTLENNTIDMYLSDVQLELGDTATDFEHRSYGEELVLCQRYYQRHPSTSGSLYIGRGYCGSNGHAYGTFSFPTMRVNPTATYGGQAHANCVGDFNITTLNATTCNIDYILCTSNVTAEHPIRVGTLYLDSEL